MAYEDPFIPDADLRIVSIENDGVWTQGGVYTVTWYQHDWIVNDGNDVYTYKLAPVRGPDVTGNYGVIANPVFSTYTKADLYIDIASGTNFRGFKSTDFTDYTTLSMNSDITHSATRGSDLGGTGPDDGFGKFYFKFLWTSTFTVSATATLGEFVLGYMGFHNNLFPNPDVHTETQRVYYPINIIESGGGFSAPSSFPKARRDNYNPDQYFDEKTNLFTDTSSDLTTLGGGRYNKQLVVLSDQGKVYFGALT